jgi:hypothetical protein
MGDIRRGHVAWLAELGRQGVNKLRQTNSLPIRLLKIDPSQAKTLTVLLLYYGVPTNIF